MKKAKSIAAILFMTACLACVSLAFFACDNSSMMDDGDARESGQVAEETEDAHIHDIRYISAKAATCTAEGNEEYWYCSFCGRIFSDADGEHEISAEDTVMPKTGHVAEKLEEKEATCTEEGNIECWRCVNCGAYFSDGDALNEISADEAVTPKLMHDISGTAAKHATCTEDGNTAYWHCDTCGKYFSDAAGLAEIEDISSTVIPATGHTEFVKVDKKDATCTEDGNGEYYECPSCGTRFSDAEGKEEINPGSVSIPATGHSLKKTEAAEVTCTEDGNTEYWRCETCGKYYADADAEEEIEESDTVVKAFGHTAGEYTYDYENHYTSCVTCGEPLTAEAHSFGEGTECSVCGYDSLYETGTEGLIYELYYSPIEGYWYQVNGLQDGYDPSVIVIPATHDGVAVTQIRYSAFSYNYSIEKVVMLAVEGIGTSAFAGCGSLVEVDFGPCIETIGSMAFQSCDALTHVEFGPSLRSIGDSAFQACTKLRSVTLSEGLTKIGEAAFKRCTALTGIVIPSTVSSVGDQAFEQDTCSVYVKNASEYVSDNWQQADNKYDGWDSGFSGKVYYYSEDKPGETGNFWHYGDDGDVEIWA